MALSIAAALTLGFLIHALIELRKTLHEATKTLKSTGEKLDATLHEAEMTLKSVRSITDGVSDITTDAKKMTYRLSDAASGVKSVADVLADASSTTRLSIIGVRAGVRAGLEVLLNNLTKKGGRP